MSKSIPNWFHGLVVGIFGRQPRVFVKGKQNEPRIIELLPGEVIRLDKNSAAQHLQVLIGITWLTETPAKGDHLLASGSEFTWRKQWPVVIEAVTRSKIRLR